MLCVVMLMVMSVFGLVLPVRDANGCAGETNGHTDDASGSDTGSCAGYAGGFTGAASDADGDPSGANAGSGDAVGHAGDLDGMVILASYVGDASSLAGVTCG